MKLPLLLSLAIVFAGTLESPAADISSRVAVHIRNATYHNLLRYAPEPVFPRNAFVQCASGHGLFAIDIGSAGLPDDVRIVKSTGCPVIDNAIVSALRQWRFVPHLIQKATVPVSFDTRTRQSG